MFKYLTCTFFCHYLTYALYLSFYALPEVQVYSSVCCTLSFPMLKFFCWWHTFWEVPKMHHLPLMPLFPFLSLPSSFCFLKVSLLPLPMPHFSFARCLSLIQVHFSLRYACGVYFLLSSFQTLITHCSNLLSYYRNLNCTLF